MASPPHAALELVRRVLIVRAALWQLDAIKSEEELRLASVGARPASRLDDGILPSAALDSRREPGLGQRSVSSCIGGKKISLLVDVRL